MQWFRSYSTNKKNSYDNLLTLHRSWCMVKSACTFSTRFISMNNKRSRIFFGIANIYLSIKAPVCQWVSLCVCLDVPELLRNGEPQRAEILRDDSPWDWEGFRLKNIWIRRTVSWKITCILAPHSTLAVNFILSSMNLQRICEVGRGWGD